METKKTTEVKIKTVSIYDVDHPIRKISTEIITKLVEPILEKGFNSKKFQKLEDGIVTLLQKRLTEYIKPIKKSTPIKKSVDSTKGNFEDPDESPVMDIFRDGSNERYADNEEDYEENDY
jgi:hypothetical protein